jgi:starch phosphorylase
VTNGIHVPTWDSAGADSLWTKACGRIAGVATVHSRTDVRRLTDGELWQMRTEARKAMLTQVRDRYARQLSAEGDCSFERRRHLPRGHSHGRIRAPLRNL